jgi:NAD(P)H-hydrate repair Nnr-like enzyme with NAD(P)H-hydrate dehydratase domain
VLTPHAGEIAALIGIDKREVKQSAAAVARHAAERYGATVVLKGAQSWIAEPGGALFRFTGGSVGLGTSGSGDALAGIVAGLAANGARPCTASAWGVWAHAAAGALLAKRIGKVGFLARELLVDLPALLRG